MSAHRQEPFRTVGATTCWSVDQTEQMLLFLDALRDDIWARYGEEIIEQHHREEGYAAVTESQLTLELEEPPF